MMRTAIKIIFSGLILASAVVFFPLESIQADVAVTGSNLTGSRSTANSGQINASGPWGSFFGGFKISWDISFNSSTNLWHYIYSVADENGGSLARDLSHFILEVSPNATANDFDMLSGQDVEGPKTFTSSNGNPNIPSSVFGIKFDDLDGGTETFDFLSTKSPVWGDFYAKDGNFFGFPVTASNVGFGVEPPSSGSYDAWIPRPDTASVQVPEPGTFLILGSGLAAAIAARKKRFLKKKAV